MLEIRNLNIFYADIQILKHVSFNIAKGEKVCLVGSNGAGKTTLLKTICGLVSPESGEIKFLGEIISNLDPSAIVEKGLVRVPEGRLIFPFMTVLENLELGAYNRRAQGDKNISLERIFGFFPILKERQNQFAGTLSGGEQQSLAIARGLMSLPQLLILDEPSLGLAPLKVREIFEIIGKLNTEGMTIFLVEQNVFNSLRISHRGYVLENGSIVLDGIATELLGNDLVRKAYLGL